MECAWLDYNQAGIGPMLLPSERPDYALVWLLYGLDIR